MARKGRKPHDPRFDRHHIRPKSRGGGTTNNITVLPVKFHALLHQLFVNMTLPEIHDFLDEVLTSGTTWTYKSLDALRCRIMRQRLAS